MATFPRRGEVWLVNFPDDPKFRPALIVSPDVRNEFANTGNRDEAAPSFAAIR